MQRCILGFLALCGLVLPLACDHMMAANPVFPWQNPVPPVTLTPTPIPTAVYTPTVLPTPVLTATCPLALINQWGALGLGNGQFKNPADVATDGSGNVYVLDSGNLRVQEFNPAGGFTAAWNDTGLFVSPSNIQISVSLGKIFILDTANNLQSGVVRVFLLNGSALPYWDVPLNSRGLALDSQGNVYVGNITFVTRYDYSGNNPIYYYNQGITGSHFPGVGALAVDSSANLFVGAGPTVQKFNSAGQYQTQWGSSGTGTGQFFSITYMCTDAQGNVYVVDNPVVNNVFSGRIQKFDNNGNFICYYQDPGIELQGLSFDPSGNLYVVDTTDPFILKF
jgi:hypothetical protein